MNYIKILSILLLFISFSQATVYEDGSNNNPHGSWRIYGFQINYASVNSIYDYVLNSDVIEFEGKGSRHSFILGGMYKKYRWDNHKEKILSWKMKFKQKFRIFVYTRTKKGRRIFIYDSSSMKKKELPISRYIHIGLGEKSHSGEWIKVERNLEKDLQEHEKENRILAVDGFRVQGLGRIDNIELNSYSPPINLFLAAVLTGETHPEPKVTVTYNENNTRAYIFVESDSQYANEYQGLTSVNISNMQNPTIISNLSLEASNYNPAYTNLFLTENGSILVLTVPHFMGMPGIKIYSIDISNNPLTILDSKIHWTGLGLSNFQKVDNLDIFYTREASAEKLGSNFFYVEDVTGTITHLALGIPGFSDYNYIIDHGVMDTNKYYKTYRKYTYLPYAWVSRKEIYDISNLPATTLLETIIFDESNEE